METKKPDEATPVAADSVNAGEAGPFRGAGRAGRAVRGREPAALDGGDWRPVRPARHDGRQADGL